MQLEQLNVLQGGAIFDSEVKNWIDFIFEKDVASGRVIIHQEHLKVPEGLEKFSSPEEVNLRNEVYTFNAILNSYRIRQLCTIEKVSEGESLLHAHAELFLSKAYAAWNLNSSTRPSRMDFENRLKRLTDPTLTMLFTGNAPVCSVKDEEIIESSDLKIELDKLRVENASLKEYAEQAKEEMETLQTKLMQREEQIKLMQNNLNDSIEAGLFAKENELQKLRESTDLIVASALQEQKNAWEEMSTRYPGEIASLKADIRNLQKERLQLEHYLHLARDALLQKQNEKILKDGKQFERRRLTEEEFGSDEEAFTTNVPVSSTTLNDIKISSPRRPENKGCVVM